MAKKSTYLFSASATKNPEKGGAWLAKISLTNNSADSEDYGTGTTELSAWSNASACKRWIKAKVQAMTPRKSVKMVATSAKDAKGKPIQFDGSLTFKK
jgi:hypothetical protein